MGRFFLLLGIGLMLFAFVVLFFMLQGADNSTTASVLETLHCNEGETIKSEEGAYTYNPSTRSGGRSINFYCVNPLRESAAERDVTGRVVMTGLLGFTVPFVGGLLLFIFSIFAITRRVSQTVMGSLLDQAQVMMPENVVSRTYTTPQGATVVYSSSTLSNLKDLPPETAQMIEKMMGGIGVNMGSAFAQLDQDSLAEKLEQLKDALDKGLISQAEHDQLRQNILDKMD